MKRVVLKDKSPEFADQVSRVPKGSCCEAPGCTAEATHRAPRDRSLAEYYQFCQAHVAAYNQTWDFFEGMSESDIQDHMRASMMGDRPTWRFTAAPDMEENLRAKAYEWHGAGAGDGSNGGAKHDEAEEELHKRQRHHANAENSPEGEAMTILGLEPPTSLESIKKRYKTLAKTYHPDINRDNPDAEELLKSINMAYTVLKVAYEKYERLIKP